MDEIKRLHEDAMRFAELATVKKIKGEPGEASRLMRQAFESELKAARLVQGMTTREPTRSVLFRSAASLAIDCNELRQAEKLIATGLSGDTPPDIAEELRDLFEKVNFHRYLKTRGIVLDENELQMAISGSGVSAGLAPTDLVVGRIEDAGKLIFRTVERLLGQQYRDSGPVRGSLKQYGLFLSAPRAGSFAVTLRISRPIEPLPGFDELIGVVDSAKVIDEVMSCLDTFNKSAESDLRKKIPDEAYFNNFIAIAKNIAPDGNFVKKVGFTAVRRGEETQVNLILPRDRIPFVLEIEDHLIMRRVGEKQTITGNLLFADARETKKQTIKLIDDTGKPHNIIVPKGMMSDIVKPLWEERVVVTGYCKGKSVVLEDINKAE